MGKVGSQGQLPETPIGRGGKMDDTSVVVGEVVEWTEAHSEVWAQVRRNRQWLNMVSCGGIDACRGFDRGEESELDFREEKKHTTPQSGNGYGDSECEDQDDK